MDLKDQEVTVKEQQDQTMNLKNQEVTVEEQQDQTMNFKHKIMAGNNEGRRDHNTVLQRAGLASPHLSLDPNDPNYYCRACNKTFPTQMRKKSRQSLVILI